MQGGKWKVLTIVFVVLFVISTALALWFMLMINDERQRSQRLADEIVLLRGEIRAVEEGTEESDGDFYLSDMPGLGQNSWTSDYFSLSLPVRDYISGMSEGGSEAWISNYDSSSVDGLQQPPAESFLLRFWYSEAEPDFFNEESVRSLSYLGKETVMVESSSELTTYKFSRSYYFEELDLVINLQTMDDQGTAAAEEVLQGVEWK